MRKLLLTSLLSTGLILGTPSFALAGSDHHRGDRMEHHEKRAEKRLAKLEEKLDLTPEQVEKIKAIHASNKPAKGERKAAMKEYRKELAQLDPLSSEYETKVNELSEKMGADAAERFKKRAMAKREVFQVLTPDQQEKFKSMMQKHVAKR